MISGPAGACVALFMSRLRLSLISNTIGSWHRASRLSLRSWQSVRRQYYRFMPPFGQGLPWMTPALLMPLPGGVPTRAKAVCSGGGVLRRQRPARRGRHEAHGGGSPAAPEHGRDRQGTSSSPPGRGDHAQDEEGGIERRVPPAFRVPLAPLAISECRDHGPTVPG